MSEWIKYLLFVLIAMFAYVWITKRFWDIFLVRKQTSLSTVLPWILLCAFQFVAQYFRNGTSLLLTLLNTLLVLFVVFCSYEAKGLETCFLLLFFCAMWASVEFTLLNFFSTLKIDYQSVRPFATISSLILMMAFTHIVSLFSDKKEKAPIPNHLSFLLIIIPIGTIYIMLVQHFNGSNDFLSISVFIILLLFNILCFNAYIKFNRYFLRERENAVYAQQLSMVSQNMEEQQKLMEEFYAQKHDLINELTALRGSINEGNNADALQYLDKLLDCYHGMGTISSCGNSTVDAIINAKYPTAKRYGISFHLQISVPEELAIASRDLGVVIGNALDNAITAVKECVSSEKSIYISLGIKKNALIVVIKNPYEHPLRRTQSDEFLTTKPEKGKHGYGIRSIRRIAETYHGDVVIDADNGCFVLTIVLNLKE